MDTRTLAAEHTSILATASARIRTAPLRSAVNALYAFGFFLVTGQAIATVVGVLALVGLVFLDVVTARGFIARRDSKLALMAFLGTSWGCFLISCCFAIGASLYGGEAGKLLSGLYMAGALVNVAANLYQSRIFVALMAAPPLTALLLSPALPTLSPGPGGLQAEAGAVIASIGFLVYLVRLALSNVEREQAMNAAIKEAEDGRADAEARRLEADKASRAKSELLANMSHELRTPLNAVIGYSEILVEELNAIEAWELLEDAGRIRTAGMRLLNLIEDLLDLSKIDAGRMEISVTRFDIAALIGGVVEDATEAAGARGNAIEIDVPVDIGFARSDAVKLRLTLANLISNAIRFTEGGHIRVSAGREIGPDQDQLLIVVADTGAGIARDHLTTLFEPFGHADAAIAERKHGTGLTLSKTRRFMQMLGGDMAAYSVLGEGSTFTIRIPANLDAAPRDEELAVPEDARTILIIEDDPTARDLTRRAAARVGFRAICTETAADGLFRAKREAPALIVLDIELPDRNGWDILTMLKQDQATRPIPVLVVSIVGDRPRALMLGAAGCLVKPVGREQLAAAIRDFADPQKIAA